MYYLIKESLTPCSFEEIKQAPEQAAAILRTDEWNSLSARLIWYNHMAENRCLVCAAAVWSEQRMQEGAYDRI